MAHSIRFESFGGFILSEKEARDFVDLFYRWGNASFIIRCNESERKFRGEHQMIIGGVHQITLVRKNIERDFRAKVSIGGNLKAPTLQVAAGMVLAHELQHANQVKVHKLSEGFFKDHRYWNRACERDARQFVDEHLNEICAYFGSDAPVRRKVASTINASEEALAVAALLSECSEVTMDDVKEELRSSRILTPANVQIVVSELRRQGFEVGR